MAVATGKRGTGLLLAGGGVAVSLIAIFAESWQLGVIAALICAFGGLKIDDALLDERTKNRERAT